MSSRRVFFRLVAYLRALIGTLSTPGSGTLPCKLGGHTPKGLMNKADDSHLRYAGALGGTFCEFMTSLQTPLASCGRDHLLSVSADGRRALQAPSLRSDLAILMGEAAIPGGVIASTTPFSHVLGANSDNYPGPFGAVVGVLSSVVLH